MDKPFQVSVIIPVYNAAKFVSQAVESALEQPETAEVLLIEDGSPDNALEICQHLTEKYEKVKLLRHPNGENRGAGASRNLGMKNALYEYIAFLDADDYYLPGRFTITRQIFEEDVTCEGVYEAARTFIENKSGEERWLLAGRSPDRFYTMKKNIPPEELTKALLNSGKFGYFILDSFSLKKSVLLKTGFMNEQLKLHQDTDFILRASCVARLLPGRLAEPVSMVRVHDLNRITASKSQSQKYKNRMKFWMSLYDWVKENGKPEMEQEIIHAIVGYNRSHKYFKNFPTKIFPARLVWTTRLIRLFKYPEVLWDLIKHKN